jgi:hypothetical protein
MKTCLYFFVILFCLCFFGENSFSQTRLEKAVAKTIYIDFDQNGKMTGFPPPVIRKTDYLVFRVKTDTAYYGNQKRLMTAKLNTLLAFLNDPTNAQIITYLFNCNPNIQKDLVTYLQTTKASIAKLDFAHINTVLDTSSSIAIPVNQYLKNVSKQFEIRIYNGSTLLHSTFLAADKEAPSNCYQFSGDQNSIESLLVKSCNSCVADSLNFKLVYHNPMTATAIDWYKSRYNKDYPTYVQCFINDLMGLDTLNDSRKLTSQLQKVYGSLSPLTPWIDDWLWYTGGKLTLNPLQILTQADITKKNHTIDTLNRAIDSLQQINSFIDSTKKHIKPDYQTSLPIIPTIIKAGNLNKNLSAGYTKQVQNLQKAIANDNAMRITEKTYYSGVIFFKARRHLIVQKQYNAADHYKAIYKNPSKKYRLEEVPENEQVNVLITNGLNGVNYKVTAPAADATFNDLEEFTKVAEDQLSSAGLTAVMNPIAASATSKVTSTLKADFNVAHAKFIPILVCNITTTCAPNNQDYLLDYYNDNSSILDSLSFGNISAETVDALLPAEVKETTDTAYKYYTYAFDLSHANDTPAPYTRNFTIQGYKSDPTKTTNLKNGYINVGKLRYFELAAGIAFTRSPSTVSTVDTTGKKFKINTADNTSEAILGFKFYPIRSYQRDRSIFPRYPFRRLHLSASLEVLHPLDNFYLGIGYDIVPGLSFDTGFNCYKYPSYTVSNNTITNTVNNYKWSGRYYSITINPVLFAQLIKTFF